MSVVVQEQPPHRATGARIAQRAGLAFGTVALAVSIAGFLALALSSRPAPPLTLAVAAGIAGLAVLALALARFDAAVALGMLIFGFVLVEPAPPDAVLAIAIAVALVTGRFSLRAVPMPILGLIGAFLVLNLLSAMFALDPARAGSYFLITLYLTVFAVWIAGYVDSFQRAATIVRPLVAGAVVSAALGVAALFVAFPGSGLLNPGPTDRRAHGFFEDANVFGPFLVVPAVIVLGELLEPRFLRSGRLVKAAMLSALGLGILFAYSRAGWLNAALAILVMLIVYSLRRGGGGKAFALLLTLVAMLAVTSTVLAATGSVDFLRERAQLQSYDANRFAGQERGIGLVRDYPLGIGPGQFEQTVGIASHSTYVRALGEQGLLGLAAVLGLMLGTLVLGARNAILGYDSFGIGSAPLLAAWFGIAANSAFVDTLHWRHLWLVAALIWAGSLRQTSFDPWRVAMR